MRYDNGSRVGGWRGGRIGPALSTQFIAGAAVPRPCPVSSRRVGRGNLTPCRSQNRAYASRRTRLVAPMQPCPAADSPVGSSHAWWLAHKTVPDTPPALLHPHYWASQLLPGGPPLCAASVLYLSLFPQLEDLPSMIGRASRSRSSPMGGRASRATPSSSARQLPTFRTGAQAKLAPPVCRTPPGQ